MSGKKNRNKYFYKKMKAINIAKDFFKSWNKWHWMVLIFLLILASATFFFSANQDKKNDQSQNEPSGLIEQYRKKLPQLEEKAKSGNPIDLQEYGIALYATGDLEKAEQIYKKQAESDNKNFLLHNNLANTLRDLGKYEEAIKEYEKAIEISPNSTNSYINLASVFQYSLKDLDKALEIYKKAIEKNPENIDFLNLAGIVAEQKGDKEMARSFFEKTLSVQSDNQTAKSGLERLR